MRYVVISLMLILQGCNNPVVDPVVGGSCDYKSSMESVEIVSISDVNKSNGAYVSCDNSPVKVMFKFKSSPTLKGLLSSDKPWSLYDTLGKYTTKAYIKSKGLTVGSQHKVKVDTITSGTCTPILFNFVDINFSDRENYCKE